MEPSSVYPYVSLKATHSCVASAARVHRKHSVRHKRTDYRFLQQMPVPVNNAKGKQQLNDQTHYSSRQIKATRDCDVLCVSVCMRDAALSSFSFLQPECFGNPRGGPE